MKRWTILISLTALLLSPSASSFGAETPLKTINVAVPAVSLLQAPLFVAIDAGAFKQYGMDVRYVLTGARTIQALVGGSVHFAQGVSSRTVPSAVLGGADAILIANFVDKLLFTMHSAPEINSMQELKGKVVGVSGIGGSTDFATRLALREAGLGVCAAEKCSRNKSILSSRFFMTLLSISASPESRTANYACIGVHQVSLQPQSRAVFTAQLSHLKFGVPAGDAH